MTTEKYILLVEDNADDEELTLRAFRKSNMANTIVVVRDGEEALEYLFATGRHAARNASHRPQVVLLDLKLPKVDGLDVLVRLRADPRTRTQPVVVLTSSVEDRDVVEAYSRGANSFVRKPVDFVEFLRAVRELGLYWMVINQAPPREAD